VTTKHRDKQLLNYKAFVVHILVYCAHGAAYVSSTIFEAVLCMNSNAAMIDIFHNSVTVFPFCV